jgi:diguanylate cyclase (GGDEF)-like protein
LRHRFLFDRSTTARNLGRIYVIDAAGKVLLSSRSLDAPVLNLADRDFFQAQKTNAANGIYISIPSVSRADGYSFIGISRRLSNQDGSFGGIIAVAMRLSYFEELFKNIGLGPHDSITLLRDDGIVLMRWPYKKEYIGLNLSNARIFKEFSHSSNGSYDDAAATDGVNRLQVYSQIADLPLVLTVGRATATIYSSWNEYAFRICFAVALLCMVTVAVTMYLGHELRLRKDAEMKLADLAATDGLTGLSNRRSFNDIIAREWQRASREKSPLALLMIDSDNFKTYNDIHGHQAGDRLLQIIAAAIVAAIERGGDIGARYGGDEFAILLPGTTIPGAKLVAEKLRQAYDEICEREGTDSAGLSIGIACIIPGANERLGDLIERADHALYRAKYGGRNRTETANKAPIESVTASPPSHTKAA